MDRCSDCVKSQSCDDRMVCHKFHKYVTEDDRQNCMDYESVTQFLQMYKKVK